MSTVSGTFRLKKRTCSLSDSTATLTITGPGVDYNVTATVDADGNVTFIVPAIATGTEVTVTLAVKAANGAVLFSGSKTQVLNGDSSSLSKIGRAHV